MKRDLSSVDRMLSSTPLIDIGTTSLTGIRIDSLSCSSHQDIPIGNPIHSTLALHGVDSLRLGSDFVRTGLLFDPPKIKEGKRVDQFGVNWLQLDGKLSPFEHPLATAGLIEIARHPKPGWKQAIQLSETGLSGQSLSIADAPCPGLLDLCFMLRGPWQFLQDVVANLRIARALIEWSFEAVMDAYEAMLEAMPEQPDVVVYSDDLGFADTMYFSPQDFRNLMLPGERKLIAGLRGLTTARICFHSCGAIAPILPDIADLGVDLLNLDTKARNMSVDRVRKALPSIVAMHGCTDLCELGTAVAKKDKAQVARLTTELAQSTPVVAGPGDSLSSTQQVLDATLAQRLSAILTAKISID